MRYTSSVNLSGYRPPHRPLGVGTGVGVGAGVGVGMAVGSGVGARVGVSVGVEGGTVTGAGVGVGVGASVAGAGVTSTNGSPAGAALRQPNKTSAPTRSAPIQRRPRSIGPRLLSS